jgi:hypothetical protein
VPEWQVTCGPTQSDREEEVMDHRPDDAHDETAPDIVPEEAARGAPTIPGASDTGAMTPPISGWGATVADEDRETETPADED